MNRTQNNGLLRIHYMRHALRFAAFKIGAAILLFYSAHYEHNYAYALSPNAGWWNEKQNIEWLEIARGHVENERKNDSETKQIETHFAWGNFVIRKSMAFTHDAVEEGYYGWGWECRAPSRHGPRTTSHNSNKNREEHSVDTNWLSCPNVELMRAIQMERFGFHSNSLDLPSP